MTESTTNPTPATGNWNEQKGKLQLKFTTLSDSDLKYEDGKKDEMLTRIQTKLGKTKEELAEIISKL